MRRRNFPFWVGGPTWLFVGLSFVLIMGVLTLDRLGFDPNPVAALAVAALPLTSAAALLLDDWQSNRRRPW